MNWTNKSAAVVGDRWKLTLTENTSVPTDVETTHLVTTNDDLDSIREALAISLNTAVATAGLDIFASVKNDLLLVTNTNGTSMSLLLEVLDSTTPDLHTGTFDTTDPPTSPVTFTVERIPVAFDQWVIKKDEVEIGRYEVLESDAKSTIQAEIDAILANRRTKNMVKDVESNTSRYFPSDHFPLNIRLKVKLAKKQKHN